MQKHIFLYIMLVFMPLLAFGQGLKNSHHDFSGAAWSGNEVCRPCHTPHNANTIVPNAPLWNHQLTTADFEVYSSSSLNSIPGQPTGTSRLCLSCHDGTVAIDNIGDVTTGTFYSGFGNLSISLMNDHPVSMLYDNTLVSIDGGLKDPGTTMSGLGGTIEEDLLQDGFVQCTSCHDPHISRNTQGCIGCHQLHGSGVTKSLSLWKSNDGSALCLTCHNK